MDDQQITRRANRPCGSAPLVNCRASGRRDATADPRAQPSSLIDTANSNVHQKLQNQALQVEPDSAILRLARALARQAAREDHAREYADKARENETCRDLRPLLDRSAR